MAAQQAAPSRLGSLDSMASTSEIEVPLLRDDRPGKPLQIIDLRATPDGKAEVVILEPALQELEKILKATKADCVSVLSVMGAYRTGKSFVLDLLMRRLRVLERHFEEQAGPTADLPQANGGKNPRGSFLISEYETNPAEGEFKVGMEEDDIKVPSWVMEGNATHFTDGKGQDADMGFEWKGGKDKCTQGIWVYSRPFMFRKNGRKIALLMVDTQGAWDGQMSKHQSATIFGLTALISSKLIYNIQNRIDDDKTGNLDYFVTFANAAMSSLGDASRLGDLIFLVRDWQSYEDDWNLDQCGQDMQEHLESHIGPKVPEDHKETADRINSSFDNIWCHGLPHPGRKVTGNKWDGNITDVDKEFFVLLDHFTHRVFAQSDFPKAAAPLNVELKPRNFASVVRNFIKAFDESKDFAIGLRDAFVRVQLMTAHEEMAKQFKRQLRKELPDTIIYDPHALKEKLDIMQDEILDQFLNVKLKGLKLKDDEKEVECQKLRTDGFSHAVHARLQNNELVLKNANIKLAASPAVGLTGMVVVSHHWIGYILAPGYIVMRMQANSKRQRKGIFSSEVLLATGEDVKGFALERVKDAQAIKIALQNLRSEDVFETVNSYKAQAQAAGTVASATVKVSNATTAA